jgi:hypothetical protein
MLTALSSNNSEQFLLMIKTKLYKLGGGGNGQIMNQRCNSGNINERVVREAGLETGLSQ